MTTAAVVGVILVVVVIVLTLFIKTITAPLQHIYNSYRCPKGR